MKRYLLPVLLAAAFLISGFSKANATITMTSLTTTAGPANGYAATPVAGTSSNYCVAGFSLVSTGGSVSVISALQFYIYAASTQLLNTYCTTLYLYSSNSATYTPGTTNVPGNLVSTLTAPASQYANFPVNISVAANSTVYYYIVMSNTLGQTTNKAFNLGYNAETRTSGTTITAAAANVGPSYTFSAATPCTATVTSLGTAGGGANGLYATNPITTTGTNLPLYGIQITPITTAASERSITALNFTAVTSPAQNNNYFFGNFYLYACTSSTYSAGASTLISTVAAAGTTTLSFTTGVNILLDYNTPVYYFVLCDYNTIVPATTTWQLNYTSCTTNSTVSGTANGYNWTFQAPVTPYVLTLNSLTTTAGSSGLVATPVPNTSANYSVYVFQLSGSGNTAGTTTVNSLTFNQNGTSTDPDNAYYTTAYLYKSTTATYVPGTTNVAGNLVGTATSDGTSAITFNTSIAASNTSSSYYFIVLSNTLGDANTNNFKLTYASSTVTGTAITPSASVSGPAYTFAAYTPFSVTLASLTTTANTRGLSATPVVYGSTNYSVYGFSLIGAGTAANTTTVNTLTFVQNGTSTDADNLYYTTAYLYKSTTNTYVAGTTNVAGNLVGTATSDGTSTITFNTSIAATNSSTVYYFIVLSNTLGDANTNTFKLTYSASTASSTAITAGASLSGPAYTFKPIPPTTVTFTSIGAAGVAPTNGLEADPINTFQTGMALYGFSLAGSGTGTNETVTSITFTRGDGDVENNNNFFPTLTLYSSTSATFPGVGGPGVSAALGSVTLGANQNNFTITPTTALTVTSSTTPVYYFLVADYTALGSTYAGNTYEIDAFAATTGSGAAVTTGATITGFDYTFTAPTITSTNITTGLSPAPPANIYQGQSNLAVAGIGLSISMGSTPLTALVFSDSQNKATAALYFSVPQLYVSTSPTFSLTTGTIATLVTGATATVANGGNVTFAITGQNITTTTLYYYIVLNYSVTGGATPEVFQFAPNNYTATVNGGGQATGYGGSPNSYTCAPPIYAALVSTSVYAPSTLTNSLYTVPILGFSVSSYPSSTFTTFNFTTTESAGNVSTYFYNMRLYSSTSSDFSTATLVTDPYTITPAALNSANFTISGLSQTISGGNTIFYFVVVDYTAPNPGPQTFTPKLASIATASTTYNTAANGLPVTGTTYTLKTITTYTYYWWGEGATDDWRDPNNWTTATNLSGANAGAYPGVFATDNAVASYDYWYGADKNVSATIGNYNIVINNLTVAASIPANYNTKSVFNITVTSADSLTVASLTVGITGATKTSNLNILGTAAGGVISSIRVNGTTNLIGNSTLNASTYGIINFPSASAPVNFVGTATYDPELSVAGGLINTNSNTFLFSPSTTVYGGVIAVSSGTLSANKSTFNMNGILPEIQSSGGKSNFNSSTINVTGANVAGYVTGFALTGGTVNINGTSPLPSVINLGTATNNGINSEIQNAGGVFNLGAYSTLNINCVNSSNTYYNFLNTSGGVVTCASTSVINPTSSNAWIYNGIASNYFTLLSDANGAATIGPLGSGAKITGQFNVQRYISTASRNYRLLASPVNVTNYIPGTASAPNLVNVYALGQSATVPTSPAVTYPGAFVGGPAGTSGGFTAATGGPCLYLYQESIVPSITYYNSTYYSGKNIAVTGLSNPYLSTQSTAVALGGTGATASDNGTNDIGVPPGNGYLLYYIGNNSNSATSALNATATTGSGFINQGTIPLVMWGAVGSTTSALTNNGVSQATNPHAFAGLTMVGNPYASSIDLQKLYTDNNGAVFTNGTPTSFSELDPTNEQFATYKFNGSTVTISGSDATRYIASGQGFYITVTNAGQALTFYEDQKTTSAPTTVVESIPGTSPVVDNVTPGNAKITNALATTANAANTTNATNTTDVAALHTKQLNAAVTSVNAAVLNAKRSNPDTTTGKKLHREASIVATVAVPAATNTSPSATTATTPVQIAGLHLKFVVDSINNDQVGIYFTPKGSDKFESADALDLDGQSGKVYLSSYTSDGMRTSINSLGNYTGGKRVKLFAKAADAGIYQMQMTDISNFDTTNYSVFLIDNLKSDSLDLTLYKSYNFNYAPGTASDSNRFVLAIEHKPVPYYALLTFAGQKVTQGVELNWTVKNEFNTTKFVVQKLGANDSYALLDSLQSTNASLYSIVDQHPSLGNNTYRLQQTTSLGAITYSAPVTIGYNSTSPNGGLNIYPNPARSAITVTLTTSTVATQVATADIYNTSGTLIEHVAVNSNSFTHDVSSYQLGVYIIELKNSNGNLVGKSKFVKVQ